MRNFIATCIAAALLTACAGIDQKTEPREEREVVTGSNIPRKERPAEVTVLPREALEGAKRSIGAPTSRGGEIQR